MKIILDELPYELNLSRISDHLVAWYNTNKRMLDSLDVGDGKKLDFSPKSILRLTLKTALVPIALPAIKMMYRMKGMELEPHKKHEDLIDYIMICMLRLPSLFDKDRIYVQSIESPSRDGRVIDSLLTAKQYSLNPPRGTDTREEETEEGVSTRREALVRGWENGYGEDPIYQGSYSEETNSTAIPERISPGYEEEGGLLQG